MASSGIPPYRVVSFTGYDQYRVVTGYVAYALSL